MMYTYHVMYQSDAHIPFRQDQYICQAETLIKFMASDKQSSSTRANILAL